MRVISGSARGKRLKELQGRDIRPTTDRVKESLFNIIQFEIPGREVLDLYGGTGQLAIECLSRGAASATIVEQQKEALSMIDENLQLCKFSATVRRSESLQFLSQCKAESFDVILLDPPYETPLLEKSLFAIERFDILKKHGIIVCESPLAWQAPSLQSPYRFGKEYCYGMIKLSTFFKDPE